MDSIEFEHLKENSKLEFKSSLGGLPKSVWETYSAFANTDGGTILLGVSEAKDSSFDVVGINDPDHMIKVFWDSVNNHNVVNVNILTNSCVSTLEIDGKYVVRIDVPRANRSDRPVYVGNDIFRGTYRRNGEGDYKCTDLECLSMLGDKSVASPDIGVVEAVRIDELCAQTINDYRQRFSSLRPTHPWNSLNNDEFLIKINAAGRMDQTNEVRPTRAGLLMFGYENDILNEFPQFSLDYRKKLTNERWDDRVMSAQGTWSGNVFDFWQIVMPKILMALPHPFSLDRGLTRIDDTPLDKAVREAFANMIINAQYSGRSGISIVEGVNSIIFTNPGMLRISKAELLAGGLSDPRNPILMKMFNLLGLTEKAGSGFDVMTTGVKSVGLDCVDIEELVQPDRVQVILPKPISLDNRVYPMSMTQNVITLRNGYSDLNGAGASNVTNFESVNFIPEESIVLSMFADKVAIKNSQVAEALGVSSSKARNVLRALVDKGVLKAVGQNKSRVYLLAQ